MLQRLNGIVLHYVKYSDNSLIVTIYTEEHGRGAFMLNGIRGKKSSKLAYVQPLYLVDFQADIKTQRDIQKIKEIKPLVPLTDVPFNIAKSTVALFLAEVLYLSLKEMTPTPGLFPFLSASIQLFDVPETPASNFHLQFLLSLSRFLGFYPSGKFHPQQTPYFDMKNGAFKTAQPNHPWYITGSLAEAFSNLLQTASNYKPFNTNRQTRELLLVKLLEYYHMHLDGIRKLKSLDILKEVFS